MDKSKFQIEAINHPYSNGMLYISLGFRGGYTIHDYILDGNIHFISNYAFYNVLFNYYQIETSGIHFNVQRAVSTISFYRKKEEAIFSLKKILCYVLNHEYHENIFDDAKNITKEMFAIRYKDGAFRAKFKSYEFSDLNKQFTLELLIKDIKEINFETFTSIAKKLLVPDNINIYLSGEIEGLDFSNLLIDGNDELFFHNVRIAGYQYNPYLRQDASIISIARQDNNLTSLSIDFLNEDVTNFTKLMITEILAENIPIYEVDVWVDSLDASITFFSDNLRSYKEIVLTIDEQNFIKAQKKMLTKYIVMLEKYPEYYSIKAVSLMTIGVYIDQYLRFVDKCSFEMFRNICKKANYKITEAQVVLRKGAK